MRIIIATLFFLTITFSAFGYDLVLQWDENKEPDLATGTNPRYKIYIREGLSLAGLKTNATTKIQVLVDDDMAADPLIVQKGIKDLDGAKKYFIAVTALDEWGNESNLSDEISTDISSPAPPGGIRIIQITNNGGTVNIQ